MGRRRYSRNGWAAGIAALLTSALAGNVGAAPAASPVAQIFRARWIDGTVADEPRMQVQAIDADTYVLRQSIRTNFEGPFLYLLFGKDRALLLDTGAGGLAVRPFVDALIGQWAAAHHRAPVPLVVAHSHSHGDHIAGDAEFRDRPDTRIVGVKPEEVAAAFGLGDWPRRAGTFELGGRKLTILPTPGHQPAHIMIYDPRLKLLLSGDALYPGRIYVPVNSVGDMRDSIDRLAKFSRRRPVRVILGAHIEMDGSGRDYAQAALSHPDEHRLELPPTAIGDLRSALAEDLSAPGRRVARPGFIVVTVPARRN